MPSTPRRPATIRFDKDAVEFHAVRDLLRRPNVLVMTGGAPPPLPKPPTSWPWWWEFLMVLGILLAAFGVVVVAALLLFGAADLRELLRPLVG